MGSTACLDFLRMRWPLEQGVDVGFPQAFVRPYQATFFLAGGTFIRSIRQEHHLAAIGTGDQVASFRINIYRFHSQSSA